MTVNICGMPHEVVWVDEPFGNGDCGLISYREQEIKINKNMAPEMTEISLIHEMIHGILVAIGRNDLSENETLVQSLAVGIWQGFEVKKDEEDRTT